MLKTKMFFAAAVLWIGLSTSAAAEECYLGEIRYFAFNYCPNHWLQAKGMILPANQYQALFSLYGWTYGGSQSPLTFALPDLRGRALLGEGQGTVLTLRDQGDTGGGETITQTTDQMAGHSHPLLADGSKGNTHKSGENALARVKTNDPDGSAPQVHVYSKGAPDTPMDQASISTAGGGQPMNSMPPYAVLMPCICVTGGYWPPRP